LIGDQECLGRECGPHGFGDEISRHVAGIRICTLARRHSTGGACYDWVTFGVDGSRGLYACVMATDSATDATLRLLDAIRRLGVASHLSEVQEIVRTAARDIARCDGATFVLRDGDQCFYADEDAIAPLWKGSRFPLDACISGWAMLNRQHVVIPDIYVDDRIPHEAYRPTFVKSLLMMPMRTLEPMGAIGTYWASPHTATEQEVSLLAGLADAASIALEKVNIAEELAAEVAVARRDARVDELTGLLNRRGFFNAAHEALDKRTGGWVAYIDLDGLKAINDRQGHAAGDLYLTTVAEDLRRSVRQGDLVARLGGDEFVVFGAGDARQSLSDRIEIALQGRGSVGLAQVEDHESLEAALLEADASMYETKRSRALVRAG
jgi:diguanylate cyclase (GGDEF)-like protein